MTKPRPVGELLNLTSRLQHLSGRARAAVALREQVQAALPEGLATHVTGASHRREELTVMVDSPAFCARLRFEAPRLKSALAAATGLPVARVRVRVQPPR